ncbi:hypothetical protein M405DRAFT_819857 [Rhizopogon salebrosus TDB-379]|nr:hypothetical protein M405DRAFT_819857 [Rhizopogon salebrosus TDB-379]
MANTLDWSHSLPTLLFGALLPKLAVVLELIRKAEGTVTPSAKQALLQATNDFKHELARARDCASTLAGVDLLVEEQDSIITMLEMLKQHKKEQLTRFTECAGSSPASTILNVTSRMEIDSTASTPFASGQF